MVPLADFLPHSHEPNSVMGELCLEFCGLSQSSNCQSMRDCYSDYLYRKVLKLGKERLPSHPDKLETQLNDRTARNARVIAILDKFRVNED